MKRRTQSPVVLAMLLVAGMSCGCGKPRYTTWDYQRAVEQSTEAIGDLPAGEQATLSSVAASQARRPRRVERQQELGAQDGNVPRTCPEPGGAAYAQTADAPRSPRMRHVVELKLLEEKPARGPLSDLAIAPRDLRMCNFCCEAVGGGRSSWILTRPSKK